MPSTASLRFPSPPTHHTPPPAPCPWLWRCHGCHIWYRLATTRRCLECDHEFCLSDSTSNTRSSSSSSSKRKRSGGPCRAEFDYIGWAARGAWRRTMLLNAPRSSKTEHKNARLSHPYHHHHHARRPLPTAPAADVHEDNEAGGLLLAPRRWLPQSALTTAWGDEHRALEHGIEQLTDRFAEKKEALYVRRRHNCWLHCDFPSECHHAVYKAQQEGKPVLARARALDAVYLAKAREERAVGKGPAGMRRVAEGLEGKVGHYVKQSLLVRSSSVEEEEESSDSGSSDSDFDRDADDDDNVSQPGSPPTEDEVVECQDSAAVSPILPSDRRAVTRTQAGLDLDGDYSYTSFKKSAGIPSPPPTTLTFEIHVDDAPPSPVSPPTSPVTSSATASPIPIPSTNKPAAVPQVNDADTNATEALHTILDAAAALNKKRHSNSNPITTNPASSTAPTLLEAFTPFKPFWTTIPLTTTTIPPPTSCERTTAAPSPTEQPPSPSSPTSRSSTHTPHPTLSQLEQAYSAQAWYPPSTNTTTTPTDKPNHPNPRRSRRASSRAENTARMLTLLSRRTSLPPSPPRAEHTVTSSVFEPWDDSDTEAVEEDGDVDHDGDRCMLDG